MSSSPGGHASRSSLNDDGSENSKELFAAHSHAETSFEGRSGEKSEAEKNIDEAIAVIDQRIEEYRQHDTTEQFEQRLQRSLLVLDALENDPDPPARAGQLMSLTEFLSTEPAPEPVRYVKDQFPSKDLEIGIQTVQNLLLTLFAKLNTSPPPERSAGGVTAFNNLTVELAIDILKGRGSILSPGLPSPSGELSANHPKASFPLSPGRTSVPSPGTKQTPSPWAKFRDRLRNFSHTLKPTHSDDSDNSEDSDDGWDFKCRGGDPTLCEEPEQPRVEYHSRDSEQQTRGLDPFILSPVSKISTPGLQGSSCDLPWHKIPVPLIPPSHSQPSLAIQGGATQPQLSGYTGINKPLERSNDSNRQYLCASLQKPPQKPKGDTEDAVSSQQVATQTPASGHARSKLPHKFVDDSYRQYMGTTLQRPQSKPNVDTGDSASTHSGASTIKPRRSIVDQDDADSTVSSQEEALDLVTAESQDVRTVASSRESTAGSGSTLVGGTDATLKLQKDVECRNTEKLKVTSVGNATIASTAPPKRAKYGLSLLPPRTPWGTHEYAPPGYGPRANYQAPVSSVAAQSSLPLRPTGQDQTNTSCVLPSPSVSQNSSLRDRAASMLPRMSFLSLADPISPHELGFSPEFITPDFGTTQLETSTSAKTVRQGETQGEVKPLNIRSTPKKQDDGSGTPSSSKSFTGFFRNAKESIKETFKSPPVGTPTKLGKNSSGEGFFSFRRRHSTSFVSAPTKPDKRPSGTVRYSQRRTRSKSVGDIPTKADQIDIKERVLWLRKTRSTSFDLSANITDVIEDAQNTSETLQNRKASKAATRAPTSAPPSKKTVIQKWVTVENDPTREAKANNETFARPGPMSCDLCNTACCVYTALTSCVGAAWTVSGLPARQPTEFSLENSDAARIKAIERAWAQGPDTVQTFQRCTDCSKLVCPACCSRCAIALCGCILCNECRDGGGATRLSANSWVCVWHTTD